MNCPNCGAKNDADARFCEECGAPLENQDIEATMVGQNLSDVADSDQTIMPSPEELAAEEAKTVTVDYAKLVEAAAAESNDPAPSPPPVPEAAPPPPPPDPSPPSSGDGDSGSIAGGGDAGGDGETPAAAGGGQSRKMWILIGVVVLVLLCICCCCSVPIGSCMADPNSCEDIIRELTAIPAYLPFV